MKKEVGLWIDHREATIVILTKEGEEIRHVTSNSEKQLRYSGRSHFITPENLNDRQNPVSMPQIIPEDQRDRKYMNRLNSYYDEIIGIVRTADSIRILGPGEAKHELQKRLEHSGLKSRILTVESVGKMTERQISAKIRGNFPA